jgi:hypothetical protein
VSVSRQVADFLEETCPKILENDSPRLTDEDLNLALASAEGQPIFYSADEAIGHLDEVTAIKTL